MADARTAYRSAFRGSRADGEAPSRMSISYPQPSRQRPQKPQRPQRPTAETQAAALEPAPSVRSAPPADPLSLAYSFGGFDALKQMQGWYDLPEYVRRKIMEGVSGL